MKILKIILIVLAIVIALFLLVALFLPNKYHVERSITIDKPVDVVYAYIADMNNRPDWDPWLEKEPSAASTYTIGDSTTGVGSVWEWNGEKLGSGSLTTLEADMNKSIEGKLVFESPQAMESKIFWNFEPIETGTKVIWAFEGDLDYPIGRYFGLMMDKMMGPDFEKGLSNIKKALDQG